MADETEENEEESTKQSSWTTVKHKAKFDHPVYKDISKVNGYVNRLKKDELILALKDLGLDYRGNKEVIQKRLKSYYKKEKINEAKIAKEEKNALDYYCVIDFEGTCEEINPEDYVHEIIEFPVVLVNAKTFEIEDEFHEYCRPLIKRKLSDFCQNLTGISQETVDSADPFPEVLERFLKWLERNELVRKKFAIVTDGPWDIEKFLVQQCELCNIPVPSCAKRWINLRRHYQNFYKLHGNLETMLMQLGMQFEGRQHSGLDDARNITRILVKMIEDGCPIKFNAWLSIK